MSLPAQDRSPLLNNTDSSDDELGYDSPVFIPDSGLSSPGSDTDYTSSGSSTESETSSDDDSSDDLDDIEDPNEVNFTSTGVLVNNIRYIMSMPELCDVTFSVGPQRLPVHGLKAIVGSRSQALKRLILQHHRLQHQRKQKKATKLAIVIDNYDINVFRQFINYVHTGSIVMDVTTVVGLTCAATEFDVPDLASACWVYLKLCATTATNFPILQNETHYYGDHAVTEKIKTMLEEIQNRNPSLRKETAV